MAKKATTARRPPLARSTSAGSTAAEIASIATTAGKTSAAKAAGRSKLGVTKSGVTTAKLPAQIRQVDQELVNLLNRRAELTTALLEADGHAPARLYDPASDDAFYRQLEAANPGPLPTALLRRVYQELFSAVRAKVRVLRAAYLGPEFSFSHLAAIQRFGQAADLVPVGTIAAVFEEVNRGRTAYGIVPIENSTDGRIVDTLSMFTRLPVRICGEVQLTIHLHLLANGPRGEITEIYSKPQALSQCRNWLARNMPKARPIEVTSTSTAAQLARTKPGAAAVASAQAAVDNDLQILAENIEDNPHNVTRFVVIGDEPPPRSGNDRTALLLQIPHQPGALHEALGVFKKQGLNLTWIESFPLHGPEAGYQFFVDFEGHSDDAAVKKAIADLEKKAVRLDMLGSYPKSAMF